MRRVAGELGLSLSSRSVRRVLRGEVLPEEPITGEVGEPGSVASRKDSPQSRRAGGGPELRLGDEERAAIADILGRTARAGYLEVEDLQFRSRPGEISIIARVYEPEEEYE